MDNLSHSVVGLALGALLQRSLPPETDPLRARTRRRLLPSAAWGASNLPDLDLVLTPLLPAPLGYLLHHRGHTHTLLFLPPLALALLAALWLLWPAARALLRHSAPARRGLGAALALGLGLHLLMDYLNSYGLHPFYPFERRWYYGDAVFIIEPVFWVVFGAPLAASLGRAWRRYLLLAALAAILCWFAARAWLAWDALAVLLAVGAGLGILQQRAAARGRAALLLAFGLGLGFTALQGGAAALARRHIGAALHQADPAARLLDVALTAFPAHPLCWVFVSLESDERADRYRLRRGILSLAPAWLAPQQCPSGLNGRPAAPGPTPAIALLERHDASLSALHWLARADCLVAAWLRFARMPALGPDRLSDLRFGPAPNFSTLRLAGPRACPGHVPGWGMPRADLLAAPP